MAKQNKSGFPVGFAPYNFIPFHTGEIPIRYPQEGEGAVDLPAFNARNEGTLSGYVEYKIDVLTDLAIGGDLDEMDEKKGKEAPKVRRFYRDTQGRLAIPGSEMRGLIRSAAEILSLVRPEAIADERYTYCNSEKKKVPYRHSVRDGLPMHDGDTKGLDYVQSMFGYLGEGESAGYKSRLSFMNAQATGYDDSDLEERNLELLSPRGTAFDMYLEQVGRSRGGKGNKGLSDYNDEQFRLRGSKIYWKRSKALLPEKKDSAVQSCLEVLKAAGNNQNKYFTGRIYFDNLHEDELGLLLLSLQYKAADDNATNESRLLGGAKPYGYGKVKISLEGLQILEDTDRYISINPTPKDMKSSAEQYKLAFKKSMNKELRKNSNLYGELPTIRVYREWLKNDNMDTELSHGGRVYMPIEKTEDTARYGNCEPIKMAYEILKIQDMQVIDTSEQERIIHTSSDNTDRRTKKDGYYRLKIKNFTKNSDFNVEPAGDDDTRKAFKGRKTAKCIFDKSNKTYLSDQKKMRAGTIIYAQLQENSKKTDNIMKKLQALEAVNWYTEEV